MILVRVPSIGDSTIEDFEKLFGLWQELEGQASARVRLEFSACSSLAPPAVAFLGGTLRWMEGRGVRVEVDATTLQKNVAEVLAGNRFLQAFPRIGLAGTDGVEVVPYREDRTEDPDAITSYLKNEWLRGSGMAMASRDVVIRYIRHLYSNAFEHSRSPLGVFSCGYGDANSLSLTVVDFGIGIPASVREFIGPPPVPAESAMEWVFEAGNSTQPENSSGDGLYRLKQFIKLNFGLLELFSHDGYARVDADGQSYLRRPPSFIGTLANVRLPVRAEYGVPEA